MSPSMGGPVPLEVERLRGEELGYGTGKKAWLKRASYPSERSTSRWLHLLTLIG